MPRAPQGTSTTKQDNEYLAAWEATMQLLREGHSFSGRERNCAFLNCGPEVAFANISAIAGFDFADDARAIAMVDWDHDGDLDCWLHNRTGPRLRLLLNQTNTEPSQQNSLMIRLQGTTVNRDAIGARVELLFEDPSIRPQIKTLYAGDAFLSQSSKWLHFGLDVEARKNVRGARVRWPGGNVEEFSLSDRQDRSLFVEGTGKAQETKRRSPVALAAKDQPSPPRESATRVPLANRPPLPILRVQTTGDRGTEILSFSERPTLIILWATWCSTCKQELQELSNQENNFDVVAISVDRVARDASSIRQDAVEEITKEWKLSFPVYSATSEMLDKLDLLGRVVLNRKAALAVPTSYLISGDGRLAAVYRGAVARKPIDDDIRALDLPLLERRNRAIPFAGTWTSPPSTLLIRPIAGIFRDRGYTDDFARFLRLEMADVRARRATAKTDEQRLQLEQQWAGDHFNIAYAHEKQREFPDAVDYYRRGLAILPSDERAWLRLVACLQELGEQEQASEELANAIKHVANNAAHRVELAKILRSQQKADEAEQQLLAAISQDKGLASAHFHLGTLRAQQGNIESAEESFRNAIVADPNHFESLLNLGALLASRHETKEAIPFLELAVNTKPENLKARLNLAVALMRANQSERASDELQTVLKLDAKNAQARLGLAQIALANDIPRDARDHFTAALEIDPDDTASSLRLAWLLATTWDESIRDSARAIAIAERLNEAQAKHPIVLDTLAAAYAAAGEFGLAEKKSLEAVNLLNAANQSKMSKEVQGRLDAYRRQKPFVTQRTQ